MHVFITGGTGFIGRHLCQLLLGKNHTLTVLSRQRDTQVRAICGDVAVLHRLEDLTPEHRFDAIVNLAGEPIIGPRWTEKRKQVLWDSRVALTAKLAEWIEKANVKPEVLVSGSAVGYYGDQGDRLLDEDSPPVEKGFGQRLCAAWEEAARKSEKYGVRVCRIRTGLVIGKGGGFLARMLPAFRLGLGGRIGDGRQWMSWVHIDNHIRMVDRLLNDATLAGPFNLTASNPVTNAEFTATLACLLGRPALLPVPAPVLRLLMGEMAELLLGSQRVILKRFQEMHFQFCFDNLEAALGDVLAKPPKTA